MKRALLIAEKPSLMNDIRAVYNKHRSEIPYEIDFTAQRGHLLTLMLPDELDPAMKVQSWDNLPFFPEEHGGWKYKIIEEQKTGNFLTSAERYAQIEGMLKNNHYDFVIHAGDPDQEGELLVDIVLQHMGCQLPVGRFWTNDLTEKHILNALKKLKNDRTDPMLTNLLSAAFVRQHSDYLFGMNISRGASQQMNGRAACGRVKTFIQACVVQREDQINAFASNTVYGVKAQYSEGFQGTLFKEGNEEAKPNESEEDEAQKGVIWFRTREEAQKLIDSLSDQAKVVSCISKQTSTYAPKLFKLSTAQMAAGKKGFNPDRTLEIIQTLYDKHKVMSYPRTSCEYMGSDEDFSGILHTLYRVPELAPYIKKITKEDIERVRTSKKWVNDKELESKGHSALRPTTVVPDFSKMTKEEREIYLMIAKRFVAMFLPPWQQDTVQLITDVNGNTFRSSGKTTTQKGYLDLLSQESKDTFVPVKNEGDILKVDQYELTEKTSQCPPHLTQADLIAICENPAKYLDDESLKKLGKRLIVGTEATRAGIIKQLIERDHYLEEFKIGRKAYVRATPTGTAMIRNLGGLLITKPDLTGTWEVGLEQVREGSLSAQQLEQQIREDMLKMLEEIKGKRMEGIRYLGEYLPDSVCPICGRPVYTMPWGWICSGRTADDPSSCKFAVRRTTAGCELKDADIKTLCRKGKTPERTFISTKSGTPKKFRAMIAVKEDKTLGFEFPSGETKMPCPLCGKPMIKTQKGYVCTDYRNGCTFAAWNTIAGKHVADADLKELLKNGITDWIKGFKKKDGSKFSAKLKIQEDGKITFSFEHTKKPEESEEERTKPSDMETGVTEQVSEAPESPSGEDN